MDKITPETLKTWGPCIEGYRRYCELFPDGADLETAIDGLVADGHDDWGYWLFSECRNRNLFPDIVSRGHRNSGHRNSGDWNSGDWNSGHWNSGDRNSGDWNSGDRNSGHWNSGHRNSGDWNSGDRNSGDWNSGDWNSGHQNSGYFCSQTPDTILAFNKPCDREEWEAAYKPNFLLLDLTYWVDESDMTDEEKADDPNFYVRGGQLRTKDYKQAWKDSWNAAHPEDRIRIKDLPNFDAEVFYEITGIRVEES